MIHTHTIPRRKRIDWTHEEVCLIVDEFIKLTAQNPFGGKTKLALAAQLVLPEHRRREPISLPAYGNDFNQRLWQLTRASRLAASPTTAPATASSAVPATVAPVAPVADWSPTLVEVEVVREVQVLVQTPIEEITKHLTTGQLFGLAIDSWLKHSGGKLPELSPLVSQAVFTPPPALRPEVLAPVKKRVCVIGIIPEIARFVEAKAASFQKIELTFVTNEHDRVPRVRCDYAILMRKFIGHRISDQVNTFVDRSKIIFVEGSQSELMQKLADLNSRQS